MGLIIGIATAIAKGMILTCLGLLLKNHWEVLVFSITGTELPESFLNDEKYKRVRELIRLIGILLIIVGIGSIYYATSTLLVGISNNL